MLQSFDCDRSITGKLTREIKTALHVLVYACFAWASGTRHWIGAGLQQIKSMQARMTRRVARWNPAPDVDSTFARRCTNWRQVQWRQAGIPWWDHAIAVSWWRWAGHAPWLSAREPDRLIAVVHGWRDAWWRKTLRFLHARGDTGAINRLSLGHRMLGKHPWDDAIQAMVSSETDTPWQSVAQDREQWLALEASFIAQVTCVTPVHVEDIPRGRHMLRDAAGLEGESA